jgi:hypothetical protein
MFFMLAWARCGFLKKGARTSYVELVFLHPVQYAGHVVHSGTSGARNVIALFLMLKLDRYRFDKNCAEYTLRGTCVLAPSGICGSCSAFWCI